MADVFSKKKRSEIMSKIRSKNTKLETSFCKLVSKKLYPQGYRYRRNYRKLPGCPDIVFLKHKIAVFIDGDFWHGYKFNGAKSRLPKKYWISKIAGNVARDKKMTKKLKKRGWQVLRIWEHEIKNKPEFAIGKIEKSLMFEINKNKAYNNKNNK